MPTVQDDIVSSKCENCSESFLENADGQVHCSEECFIADQLGVCEDAACSECGLARIGAFDCPNDCKCPCHPEKISQVHEVVDRETAIAFLAFLILKRIGLGYHPETTFDQYEDTIWGDDGQEKKAPSFTSSQVRFLSAQHAKLDEFLGDDREDFIRAFMKRLGA